MRKSFYVTEVKVMFGFSYVLIGPSGCGKTTLLSCILGMTKLDRGKIQFSNEFKSKSQIGFMPQELSLSKRLTIRELFFFFGRIYGMEEKKIQERLDHLMDIVEMTNLDDTVENCSGGEQRRISFAISMIHEPKLILLDEPTVGLDPMLRFKVWNFLLEQTKAKNLTVVITTHYIEHAIHADCVKNEILVCNEKLIFVFKGWISKKRSHAI